MAEFDASLGALPVPEHDHDVLLIAGSRGEVARLAPVAKAFADADRIHALTVATGPDPMGVHAAFEAMGVPVDVTQLPTEPMLPHPAGIASPLMGRLDELLVDLDPSAVLVLGGGMTAAVAAMVAFWRQIPVVHLQAGPASEDVLCPFPQEANRRVIAQLASLVLTTGGSMGVQLGPNAIPVGDTLHANPPPADPHFARLVRRLQANGRRLVLVGLDRPDSLGVLAGLPDLLDHEPDVEVVLFGELATHGAGGPLMTNPRATAARSVPFAELVGLLAAAAVLVSDDPELVAEAPGLGTPAVLVDGPNVPEPGDSIRSILSPAVLTTVRQVLAGARPPARQLDGLAGQRVEQAVAWMFGMCPSPRLGAASPSNTEA